MTRGRFELLNTDVPGSFSPEFIRNFQTALLLSLLDKGLLTQQQFEACEEEINKRLI